MIIQQELDNRYSSLITAMLNLSDKLVLTGGLSLQLLNIVPVKCTSDIDFGLRSMLTEQEFDLIRDFFGFKIIKRAEIDNYTNTIQIEEHTEMYDYSNLNQELQQRYWSKTNIINYNLKETELKELIEKLMWVNRPEYAISMIRSPRICKNVDSEQLVILLRKIITDRNNF